MPEIKMKLKPFRVPNYVLVEMPPRPRQEGMKETPTFHLNELDEETITALCIDFVKDVFLKSDKSPPVVSIETKTHGLSR